MMAAWAMCSGYQGIIGNSVSWPANAGHPDNTTQVSPVYNDASVFGNGDRSNWVARTVFTLRPRFARTGVAGYDNELFRFVPSAEDEGKNYTDYSRHLPGRQRQERIYA